MTFLAISADTPTGQPIAECKRVPINLTLDCPDDLEAFHYGVGALRRSKIQRLTREAQEQGALLTQEDLARLLCTSRSTIQRDIAQLRSEGIDVPTRGQIKDIGKGVSHKTRIISDWLAGYTFSQIKLRLQEYLGLYEATGPDDERLRQLLNEPNEATAEPAAIKRGVWLR